MALLLPPISSSHHNARRLSPITAEAHHPPHCSQHLSPNPESSSSAPKQINQISGTFPSPKAINAHHKLTLSQSVTHLCNTHHLNEALLRILEHEKANHPRRDPTQLRKAMETLLQACGVHKEIEIGRKVHQIVPGCAEFRDDLVLNTCLISMYSQCGFPTESRLVFDQLQVKNLFAWNTIVSGYSRNQLHHEVIMAFCELISETELRPDSFTFPCVIKACSALSELRLGETAHGFAMKMGLVSDVFVGNALIAMYGIIGVVADAVKVFDKMPQRNLVTWNSLLRGYSERAHFEDIIGRFTQMLEEKIVPDAVTMVTVLPVCTNEGDVDTGIAIHGLAAKLGLDRYTNVGNTLINMYAKFGFSSEAELLFEKNGHKNVVSWNSMIANYIRWGDTDAAFDLLRKMQYAGSDACVDEITVLNVLPACYENSTLMELKAIHCYSLKHGFTCHELVTNALIAAYAKCGSLSYADSIFDHMGSKSVNSWNAVISGHLQSGEPERALDLYIRMSYSATVPDCYSIVGVTAACEQLKLLSQGKEVHGFVLRKGLERDPYISASLLSFYFSCEKWLAAEGVFDQMENKDEASWNTMISAYLQNGLPQKALEIFRRMLLSGSKPHQIALTSLLSVCSNLSALNLGREVHSYTLKADLIADVFVSCSIIDMYAKCGCIKQARRVFDTLVKTRKNVAPWNALITGLGIHGNATEAVELFHEMQGLELKPDHFTFMGLLVACNHGGLIKEGFEYFTQMTTSYGIEPKLEHYACVVDMLGRAGLLDEALEVVKKMPGNCDARIWSSLVSSCKVHGHLDLGRELGEKLLKMEPEKAQNYVSMSNLMAQWGKWDEVRSLRRKMKDMGAPKDAGCSWIEVDGKVYNFVAGGDLFA